MTIAKQVNADNAYQVGRTGVIPQSNEQAYINFFLDFTTDVAYQLDYATLDQANQFGVPRTLFFDNLNNNQIVSVLVEGTNQVFEIPANSAGYYRINSPTKTRINFTAAATYAVKCNVALYNYDVAPIIWYKTGTSIQSVVYGPDDTGSVPTHPPVYIGGINNVGFVTPLHINALNELLVAISSLPLPLGAATEAKQDIGNASLSVLDDWDLNDRAKVSPIAGQDGVSANAGAIDATTQRVTLGSATIADYSITNMTGVSQQIVAAGNGRNVVFIQAATGNAGTVWLNLTGGAATVGSGVGLAPGGVFNLQPGCSNAITGIAATANDDLTVYAG